MTDAIIDFPAFKAAWLEDVARDDPSTVELGKRFAFKIVTQWLDEAELGPDLVYCDGSGDGGIDIAYLDRGEASSQESSETVGDTWYLVQSKHGTAFRGTNTLLEEAQKVVDTLDGRRERLSSLAAGLSERLTQFKRSASERDKIVLVFATEGPLTEEQKRALGDIRALGRSRLGPFFDVAAVSIETIYQRVVEQQSTYEPRVKAALRGHLVQSGDDLLVGSVNLVELYEFLQAYRRATNDLDQLYEKNVRKFLGLKGKINKAIISTLSDAPERFGLYNNGITIVANGFETLEGDKIVLHDPFIVNGCQTTKCIWEVCQRKLDAGGTGDDPDLATWRGRASQGVVVVKVAKVGSGGESLSQTITRFTNSQNAVRDRDFLALTGDFRQWQAILAEKYSIYLEIQRGGWDSYKAQQKQNPAIQQFRDVANAADLLKVYGAGWLAEAGMAFGKNPPFLPGGLVFRKIVEVSGLEDGVPFGAGDLYAAHLLQSAAEELGFGRGSDKVSRRQTKFLFYMVAVELVKEVIIRSGTEVTFTGISSALNAILSIDTEDRKEFLDVAGETIDTYLTRDSDNSLFAEPAFLNTFNGDLNGFLKWEQFGKSDNAAPMLRQLLSIQKTVMGRRIASQDSLRERLVRLIK